MQRCLFLLVCLITVGTAKGQGVDVLHTELSIYARDTFPDELAVKCYLDIKVPDNQQSLRFDFLPERLHNVRIKQGRLKDFVPYQKKENQLTVDLASWPNRPERITLAFDYTIDLLNPDTKPYVRNGVGVLALNGFNAYSDNGLSLNGLFFPARASDPSTFSVNISVPGNFEVFTVGEPTFKVSDPAGLVHHFWNCKQAIHATSFYLICGALEEDELEDLDEVYGFTDADLGAAEAIKLRSRYKEWLSFLKQHLNFEIGDEQLLRVDSMASLSTPRIRLPLSDHYLDDAIAGQLLLEATQSDSLKSAYLFYLSEKQKRDEATQRLEVQNYLEKKAPDTSLAAADIYTLSAEWLQNFYPDFRERLLRSPQGWRYPDSSAHLNYVDSIRKNKVLPRLKVSYRYREGQQEISLEQEEAFGHPLAIPLEITVYLRDTVLRQNQVGSAVASETFSLAADGSPQAVAVNFGPYFPAYVEDVRPDVYNLYQLSNATNEAERMDALTRLFQTSNANLFSTALGIAMDDRQAAIRLMALERAGSLNIPAQQKLKDTLISLAEKDPDLEVRKTAQGLVSKYYGSK